MLNYTYVSERFNQMNIHERRRLLIKLFGDNKQSITYFKRVANPGLEKLEVLADFLEVPLDMLRKDSKYMFVPEIKEPYLVKKAVKEHNYPVEKAVNHEQPHNHRCHYGRIYVTTSTL